MPVGNPIQETGMNSSFEAVIFNDWIIGENEKGIHIKIPDKYQGTGESFWHLKKFTQPDINDSENCMALRFGENFTLRLGKFKKYRDVSAREYLKDHITNFQQFNTKEQI